MLNAFPAVMYASPHALPNPGPSIRKHSVRLLYIVAHYTLKLPVDLAQPSVITLRHGSGTLRLGQQRGAAA